MTFSSPDLPAKFEALKSALEWASGISVYWRDQSTGRRKEANEVWGELQLFSIARLGDDDIRLEDGSDPDWPLIPTQSGARVLRFQFHAMSRSQTLVSTAWYALSKAQSRIKAPYAYENWFNDYELGIAAVGDVLDVPQGRVFDKRVEDVALMELEVNTVLTDVDADTAISYIESVKLSTSGILYADGTPLPDALQLDDEVIP